MIKMSKARKWLKSWNHHYFFFYIYCEDLFYFSKSRLLIKSQDINSLSKAFTIMVAFSHAVHIVNGL